MFLAAANAVWASLAERLDMIVSLARSNAAGSILAIRRQT
jgi:hypothetical protein